MRKTVIVGLVAVMSGAIASSDTGNNLPADAAIPGAEGAAVTAQAVRAPTAAETQDVIARWKNLRNDPRPGFSYASWFALNYPDFPGVYDDRGRDSIRLRAERGLDASAPASSVIAFFKTREPQSARGWTWLANAYADGNRDVEALAAARNAFAKPGLSDDEERMLLSRFGPQLNASDYDMRIDSLLFSRDIASAQRLLPWASQDRLAVYNARIALQRGAANADQLLAPVAGWLSTDAGLLMDRARYLKNNRRTSEYLSLLAQPHDFVQRPTDPDRWYEMMLDAAKTAHDNQDYTLAYNIARQVDDAYPGGEDIALQPYGVRDKYTDLTWLAGTTAYTQLQRPLDAARLFGRYSEGGRSQQVNSKGLYWAGRALLTAGDEAAANKMFELGAKMPDHFYGQLALERLGREVPVPPSMPLDTIDPMIRANFMADPLVNAMVQSGNDRAQQTELIRALSDALKTDEERMLATQLAEQIGRPDLAVWIARGARGQGSTFYYREAFPIHPAGVPGGQLWSYAHGVTRQESSFDRAAVSHANAHGMMQLLPGTARDQARRSGVPYSFSRLTSDPAYNVQLGSDYLALRLRNWDGNMILAAASYNAGLGNARKWVNRYGNPTDANVDTIMWIERIPFSETRSYVQRVIENSVVYDRINPYVPAYGSVHVSRHLGKSNRPG